MKPLPINLISRLVCSILITLAILLALSGPNQAKAIDLLTPTPSYAQKSTAEKTSDSGLYIPDRWSELDNGILIPHPATMNGRLLQETAIIYFSDWKGLPNPVAALTALSDYLLLSILSQDPKIFDTQASTYALRFLPQKEREKYLCDLKMSKEGGVEAGFACVRTRAVNAPPSEDMDIDSWLGSSESEKSQNRQNFINKYRGRFLAAAPKLPIDMLNIVAVRASGYDRRKGGFNLNLSLPGAHRFRHGRNNLILYTYEKDVEGAQTIKQKLVGRFPAEFWPIDEAGAEALVKPDMKLNSHLVPIEYLTTMLELRDDPADPRPSHFAAKIRWTSAVAYQDPLLEREVYRLTCPSLPSWVACLEHARRGRQP